MCCSTSVISFTKWLKPKQSCPYEAQKLIFEQLFRYQNISRWKPVLGCWTGHFGIFARIEVFRNRRPALSGDKTIMFGPTTLPDSGTTSNQSGRFQGKTRSLWRSSVNNPVQQPMLLPWKWEVGRKAQHAGETLLRRRLHCYLLKWSQATICDWRPHPSEYPDQLSLFNRNVDFNRLGLQSCAARGDLFSRSGLSWKSSMSFSPSTFASCHWS